MPTDPKAIRGLVDRLNSPLFRKSFSNNPLSALERAGIKTAGIPVPVLEALADLSLEELSLLVRVSDRVKEAGAMAADDTNGYVVF